MNNACYSAHRSKCHSAHRSKCHSAVYVRFRHGEHQVRVCRSQRHNSSVEPEGVQLGMMCVYVRARVRVYVSLSVSLSVCVNL